MSKSAPQGGQRAGLMQNLLTVAVLFLLFQLIFNALNPKPDPRTSGQILEEMRQKNAAELDQSIVPLFGAYTNKLKDDKGPAEQIEARTLEAAILVADAQLRAGIHRNDLGRLNAAYFTLDPIRKEFSAKPLWKEKVVPVADVTTNANFGWKQWTGESLHAKVIETLHAKNKTELTWGLVPGYQLMDYLVKATGAVPAFSYWFAALLLAFLVRAVVFPISHKQMMFGRQMSQLQPLITEIRETHKGDMPGQQAETMKLYKEYGINPAAGCVPLLLQMPLFLLVYQFMQQYRFEFQNGYFAWISPSMHASVPFFAPNLGEMDFLLIGIYGVSMVVSTMLMPVTDPSNLRQQRMIGIGFALFFSISMFFYPLPAAFILYWTFANVFATAQSLWAYRLPLPPLVKVNTPTGGVYPTAANGKNTNGELKLNGQIKTGKPVQHKPKKRK